MGDYRCLHIRLNCIMDISTQSKKKKKKISRQLTQFHHSKTFKCTKSRPITKTTTTKEDKV